MQKIITGTIHQGDTQVLLQLMRDQSSCRRYAYQRIHKDGLTKANDVVIGLYFWSSPCVQETLRMMKGILEGLMRSV